MITSIQRDSSVIYRVRYELFVAVFFCYVLDMTRLVTLWFYVKLHTPIYLVKHSKNASLFFMYYIYITALIYMQATYDETEFWKLLLGNILSYKY
jgi:hypothetical protein